MATTLRPNRINIDLQGYKQPWLEYCKAHDVTPSEAFRQIVAKLTGGTAQRPAPLAEDSAVSKKIRREIRLTKSELSRAEANARRDGFSLTRWIVALINARLDATPQLGQREIEVLARSNLQMLAIGRNLNQIARAANAGTYTGRSGGADVIEELHTAVMQHARQVAQVMTANVARWRQ
jgi:hypothetical protein